MTDVELAVLSGFASGAAGAAVGKGGRHLQAYWKRRSLARRVTRIERELAGVRRELHDLEERA